MSKGTQTWDCDVAVLGGGSAGYAAARTAAGAGLRVAVVDGADELGGLCILRGCMPTKALLYAGEVLHLCRQAGLWGLRTEDAGFNFPRVMARKDALIREFADYRQKQLADGRFALVRAQARFEGPHTLALSDGRNLTAGHFVVATGSRPAPLPLPALEEAGCLTSDKALTLTRLPRSIIVLGGGPVAVEFAQFFARFGVKTTVIQRSPRALKEFDDDSALELENALRREGIDLFTGTRLSGARRCGDLKEITFEQGDEVRRVAAEEIFHGLGRVPDTASLGLDQAGVRTEGGRIVTDERMRTTAPHIYAAGDCASPHEIVHVAIQQGEAAAWNIAQPASPRRVDYRLLVRVVFTDPQVAAVGLTEKEAAAQGKVCLAAKYPFNDHGKSIIMGTQEGFVKLLADPGTGEILGGACVGPQGGELIHEIVVAMAKRMTAHELAAVPHYHPTLAEIWTYPAEEIASQIVHLA